MAQLIKIEDYVTRYERNAYRYPSQYIRLKKDNWEKLHDTWENPPVVEAPQLETMEETEETRQGAFSRIRKRFSKKKDPVWDRYEEQLKKQENPVEVLPDTEEKLKHHFLDKMFDFQMKWATSTLRESSFVDSHYYRDPLLKYFLQRFSDNYLVMYKPVFEVKNAPIQSEIILISPVGIDIIYVLEKNPKTIIVGRDERTWTLEEGDAQSKVLSPLIALRRSEKIITQMLATAGVDLPIQKVVLSRTNRIVHVGSLYKTWIVDKHDYPKWFETKRSLASPLKNSQLKAADVLLRNCRTTSMKRPEWEQDDMPSSVTDFEE